MTDTTIDLTARRRTRGRQPLAVVLVVLACASFMVAVPGVWARRNFLDTERFVDRVGPLVDDPAVQEALTVRLTDQLMLLIDPRAFFEEALPERGQLLAVPLTNAVEAFVRDRVASFVASDRFEQLWVAAATVAHQTAVKVLRGESEVVTAEEGQVTLNLLPVVDQVLAQITSASPEILGRKVDLPDISVEDVPKEAINKLESALGVELGDNFGQFTVYDEGKVKAAQESVKLLDRLVVVFLPLSIVLGGLALWVSDRRRRTLLQLAAGVSLGMVLIRRVVFAFQDDIAKLPPTELGRQAAAVAVDAFVSPLILFAGWAFLAAAMVAVVALVSGPYPWAVSLRRRSVALWQVVASSASERAHDDATVAWVRAHRDQLLAGGVIAGLLVLWTADLTWAGFLVVAAAVAGFEVVVHRISTPRMP